MTSAIYRLWQEPRGYSESDVDHVIAINGLYRPRAGISTRRERSSAYLPSEIMLRVAGFLVNFTTLAPGYQRLEQGWMSLANTVAAVWLVARRILVRVDFNHVKNLVLSI
jgi:hypothetical protein